MGAYLIGSFPTAYLASRLHKSADIREQGDKNAGAANVYRNVGSIAGVIVAILDMGKGAIAILLAQLVIDGTAVQMAAGVAAVIGHNWPFFLQFRGGRGAAVAVGVLMAFVPIAAIPMSLGGLILLVLTRNTIVGLSFAFIPLPLLAWFTGGSLSTIGYTILLPTIVGLSHFASQRRLSQPQGHHSQSSVTHPPERR